MTIQQKTATKINIFNNNAQKKTSPFASNLVENENIFQKINENYVSTNLTSRKFFGMDPRLLPRKPSYQLASIS